LAVDGLAPSFGKTVLRNFLATVICTGACRVHDNGLLRRRPICCCGIALLWILAGSLLVQAQATGQVWANATFDWLATEHLTYEIDVEPKAQLVVHPNQPTWTDLDVTPHVEHAVAPWLDILGEADLGLKSESNETNTVTLTRESASSCTF
jgi:hypothetical protein